MTSAPVLGQHLIMTYAVVGVMAKFGTFKISGTLGFIGFMLLQYLEGAALWRPWRKKESWKEVIGTCLVTQDHPRNIIPNPLCFVMVIIETS